MTIPGVIALLSAAALLAAFFALWQSLRAAFGASEDAVTDALVHSERETQLREEKASLLASIKDLEFERQVGKLSEDDYAHLDQKLRGRAKDVLKLLDADLAPFRAEAERLVRERLTSTKNQPYRRAAVGAGHEKDADAPDMSSREVDSEALEPAAGPATARDSHNVPASAATAEPAFDRSEARLECAACGAQNEVDATFCKKCGERVDGAAEGSTPADSEREVPDGGDDR